MKNISLFLKILSIFFASQFNVSSVFASNTNTTTETPPPESRSFFRNPFSSPKGQKVSTPQNVRPQVPQNLMKTPETISQGYNLGQARIEDQKRLLDEKRQLPPTGFKLHPNSQTQEGEDVSIATPLQSGIPQNYISPEPVMPQSGETNIYFHLTQAIKWKISSLAEQLKMREREYLRLPADMRVQLKDLTPTEDHALINWVYPQLVEAMLQLAGQAYVRTKIDMKSGEFSEEKRIPENIKDSYFLQSKIYEVENDLKGRQDLKNYITKYRDRVVDLLANHVRLTYDMEPILGITRDNASTTLQFGIGNSKSPPLSTAIGSSSHSGTEPLSSGSEKKPPTSLQKTLEPEIGMGKLNVVDTGPLIMDFLLKNAFKIFPFKEYFGNQFKFTSIPDLLSYLSRLEGLIDNEIVSLQRKRKDLDDPNMRIAYGTAEKLALEGFEPQAILYRNTNKAQKEYSGAIYYRVDKVPEQCQVGRYTDIQVNTDTVTPLSLDLTTEEPGAPSPSNVINSSSPPSIQSQTKVKTSIPQRTNVVRDVMVIAYSGSKSPADWEKNYEFISKEASGANPLLWGYKIHSGIGKAFEEGYNELGARIGEMMLKYKRKTLNYLSNCPNTRVELYIITTGHSLGGGLSTLATIGIKKMTEIFNNIDGLNIYVSNISFAAPPVFRKDMWVGKTRDGHQVRYDWADRAEKFIGRGNILRVFVDTDPVATFSLLRQSQQSSHRSLIMSLLKYKHIGIPMLLYDIEGMFDEFSLWASHLMPRYGLLVSLFANDKYLTVRDYLKSFEDRNQLTDIKFELEKLSNTLKSLENAMQTLPQAINTNQQQELTAFLDRLVYDNAVYLAQYDEVKKVDSLLKTNTKVIVSNVETLPTGPSVKTTLGQSIVKKIEYTPFFPDETGNNIFVYSDQLITLTSSTQCAPNTFWKENIEGRFSLRPGYYPDDTVKTHTACSCCLLKNLVLSQGTYGTGIRQAFGRKGKISTIEQAMGHCVQKNYCTSEMIDQQIDFAHSSNPYNAISAWVQKFGGNAMEIWRTKELNMER